MAIISCNHTCTTQCTSTERSALPLIRVRVPTPLQGFFAALRLVSVCQLGKDPSLAVVTLADPPPRLVGIDGSTIAGFAQKKWTIEVYMYVHIVEPLSSGYTEIRTP